LRKRPWWRKGLAAEKQDCECDYQAAQSELEELIGVFWLLGKLNKVGGNPFKVNLGAGIECVHLEKVPL
jgi:hypothetical protein